MTFQNCLNFTRLTAREITYNNFEIYHLCYLWQISLQSMLLPILILELLVKHSKNMQNHKLFRCALSPKWTCPLTEWTVSCELFTLVWNNLIIMLCFNPVIVFFFYFSFPLRLARLFCGQGSMVKCVLSV